MKEAPKGKIITFYSYKGGTGRTMALANVAWILASQGKRVLMIDWDLEAPGLNRYMYPFLVDKDMTQTEGLIDFVIKYVTAASTRDEKSEQKSKITKSTKRRASSEGVWFKPYTNLLRYASSLDYEFPNGGTLDYVPAGRQGATYSTRVNSFNWKYFYENLKGDQFLAMARERIRTEYDYVLIDSRTGVSDTSGICTVLMPDLLVVCFTMNNQSIEGASAVAASVQRLRNEETEGRPLKIYPLSTRIERAEKDKLDAARELAHGRFDSFLHHLDESRKTYYWGDIEVFYEPFYAYEEILSVFGDRPFQTHSLLASFERLCGYITNNEVTQYAYPPELERARILSLYARIKKGQEAKEESGISSEDVSESLQVPPLEKTQPSTRPAPVPQQSRSASARKSAKRTKLGTIIGAVAMVSSVVALAFYFSTGLVQSINESSIQTKLEQLRQRDLANDQRLDVFKELYDNGWRDFERVDLSGLDLSGIKLTGSNFSNANLQGTIFDGAILDSVNLQRAQLDDADLSRAYVRYSDLGGASVTDTDFSGADLSESQVPVSELTKARTDNRTLLPSGIAGPFSLDEDLTATLSISDSDSLDYEVSEGFGFIWVGNYDGKMWTKTTLATLNTNDPIVVHPDGLYKTVRPSTRSNSENLNFAYTTLGTLSLFEDLPENDESFFRGQPAIGTVPRGSTVYIMEPVVEIQRGETVQYWARVEAGSLIVPQEEENL